MNLYAEISDRHPVVPLIQYRCDQCGLIAEGGAVSHHELMYPDHRMTPCPA